jgi:hypothetical protein
LALLFSNSIESHLSPFPDQGNRLQFLKFQSFRTFRRKEHTFPKQHLSCQFRCPCQTARQLAPAHQLTTTPFASFSYGVKARFQGRRPLDLPPLGPDSESLKPLPD